MLGKHGWYVDLDMTLPALWALKQALSEGKSTEADEALIDYFESRLDGIEADLCRRYPHRARCIQPAFRAHKRGEYELVIPVLLAQADGGGLHSSERVPSPRRVLSILGA